MLGRPTFDHDPILGSLAVTAFAGSVAASLFYVRDDVPELHRRLAYDLDRFWEQNDEVIGRLSFAFRAAVWAVATEVVLLLLSAGGTLV
jgi:hypothetical protein